jgi:primosomal protein N' (replication factor Y)
LIKKTAVVRVAVPTPLRRWFDYLPAMNLTVADYPPGIRVRVPFGRQQSIGIVLGMSDHSDFPANKLKRIQARLDEHPVLPADMLSLLHWCSDYYHHPIGDVVQQALPVLLRQGRPALPRRVAQWSLTQEGRQLDDATLEKLSRRAPRQAAILRYLLHAAPPVVHTDDFNREHTQWQGPVARLVDAGWIEKSQSSIPFEAKRSSETGEQSDTETGPALNPDQQHAVEHVAAALDRFERFLLDGVTGSGKTEVYLALIRKVVAAGRQALILVPEIGLTPQLEQRFRRRLACAVAVLHSGLSEQDRLSVWLAAREGQLPVIIGTRSAVFIPLRSPGLFIVDEEHDLSFKQQDGFRYSARDLAVLRAQRDNVPVLLGSATPSLESLYNVEQQRMTRLVLPERAGVANPPHLRILDIRHQPMTGHLAPAMQEAIRAHLARQHQILLFLNRRGFAPTLLCHDCGWVAACPRCDTHLTLHRAASRLQCHHCGTELPVLAQCPACGNLDLRSLGAGTERIEDQLADLFPDTEIVRIDRDSTRRKGSLEKLLARVKQAQRQVLVGTQMLAKGHHFPNVTLVGIIDADQGLYSADFRGAERMAQLIMQVAGRAGRAAHPGEVLIQTHHPEHPLLQQLTQHGYAAFAAGLQEERRAAQLPPYSSLALLRAEATAREAPHAFLQQARDQAEPLAKGQVVLFGPMAAPMEKRAGRYRAQLLVQAPSRTPLQRFLSAWIPRIESGQQTRQVRWSIDVDPQEMY